ncbi:hypothetical protein [Geothrix sp. PMB-07]|uniref:hypothetical protein n=1 Tax=Geothrix sp. PMB-07 TaxID=3068640 RepID=UPI0027405721|nr:hypothetical protein [Geothrix sp. PMB-07]WLT32333.1 hypothetical protein Q9293_03165 [Geothrix sp. PMB-07]
MEPDPLLEWNRLNKENAEQALVSVMFMNFVSRAPQIDTFSTWLLAGTGAAATLLIANILNMFQALGRHGFKVAVFMLAISALFGLLAKCVFVFFQTGGDSQEKLIQQIKPIMDKHHEDEEKIIATAKQRGLKLETEFSMNKVLSDFAAPFPKWPRWLVMRYLNKHKENRQVGHLLPVRMFQWQCGLSFFQALAFISFILAAIVYARAI